jgi:AcrR family transcriptional regulator
MHNLEKDAAEMAQRRQKILETGYRLFTEHGIEQVSLDKIARQSGIGIATLYRYFSNKQELVIETGTMVWQEFNLKYHARTGSPEENGRSGREEMEFFLDYFLELYRDHRDLFRFNQFFNIYIKNAGADDKQLSPYTEMIEVQADYFRRAWEKGQRDHTLKSDNNWRQVFSACLHIMFAAATRYAVGLLYKPEDAMEAEAELKMLRDVLLERFSA